LACKNGPSDFVKFLLESKADPNVKVEYGWTPLHVVKWLRMQGHRLPATLEVTGSNPGPGKINLIEKNIKRDS
jgi:hypothetical protein